MRRATRALATLALILAFAFTVFAAGGGTALAGSTASTVAAPVAQGEQGNQGNQGNDFDEWGLLGLLGIGGLAGLRRRNDPYDRDRTSGPRT